MVKSIEYQICVKLHTLAVAPPNDIPEWLKDEDEKMTPLLNVALASGIT